MESLDSLPPLCSIPASLRHYFVGVESRLEETLQVLTSYDAMGEIARSNPSAAQQMNARYGFGESCAYAFGSFIILSMVALTESANDTATLATIYTRIPPKDSNQDALRRVNEIVCRVHQLYARYRNKLIGHNTLNRPAVLEQFFANGFTWKSVRHDLDELLLAYKVLRLLAANQTDCIFERAHSILLEAEGFIAITRSAVQRQLEMLFAPPAPPSSPQP